MKLILSVLTALALLVPSAGSVSASSQPDIVVVMTDDLGAMGGCDYKRILDKLPNINGLFLNDGLCFNQYYNESPLCCPGRATFLSGQHTARHNVKNNDEGANLDDSQTIATAVHDAGYHTVQIGKYFNHSFSFAPQPPGWDVVLMSEWRYWRLNGGPQVDLGYVDRKVADFAVQEAKATPAGQPLFMWINPLAPHCKNCANDYTLPRIEPKYANDARCANLAPFKPADYSWSLKPNGYPLVSTCRSLLTVDDAVGSLRAEFTKQGRNPIWIFTTDNGMAWGRKGWPAKSTPESTRTPLYFSGPGIREGVTNALLSNVDLPVTIADLANVSMPWADGESFASNLAVETPGHDWILEEHWVWREQSLYWFAIRQPNWRLISITGQPVKLYNLTNDPWETNNVAGANPNKVQELMSHAP